MKIKVKGREPLSNQELIKFFEEMEIGSERTIMAIDGADKFGLDDLAIGVIKDKFFDSETTTFLVGIFGSDYDFKSFFGGDYEDETECINAVIEYLEQVSINSCGSNYCGLYIKPEYEYENDERKYNGDIVRVIDTLDWGEVELVSRYNINNSETFYDCYERTTSKFVGEFHIYDERNLDDYTDEEIAKDIDDRFKCDFCYP